MQRTYKRPRKSIEYRVHMDLPERRKSALDSLPHLRQPLHRNRHGGLQLLGEKLHAQLLEQPAELFELRIAVPRLELPRLVSLPLGGERRKLRGEARVAARIRAQLVESQARRPEIARKMLQALVRSLFDKPLGQQAGQVFLNVAAGLGKRLRHLLKLLLQCGMLGEDGPDETRYLVGEQGNARARLFAAPVEIRPGPRPGFLHAGAVERGCEQLFLQVRGAAEGHELRDYRLQTRQILLDMAGLLLELQHEQAPQAGAVSLARLVHHFLEIAELPSGDFFRRHVGPRELGELLPSLLAELGAQLGEVATGGKLPAVLVDDAEIHRKMRGQ